MSDQGKGKPSQPTQYPRAAGTTGSGNRWTDLGPGKGEGGAYRYDNHGTDGGYYYQNANGSTYHYNGNTGSRTYTPPPSKK